MPELLLEKHNAKQTDDGYLYQFDEDTRAQLSDGFYSVGYRTSVINTLAFRLTEEDYIIINGNTLFWESPSLCATIYEYIDIWNSVFGPNRKVDPEGLVNPIILASIEENSKRVFLNFSTEAVIELSHRFATLFGFTSTPNTPDIILFAQLPPSLLLTSMIHIFLHPNGASPKSIITSQAHLIATTGYRMVSCIVGGLPHEAYLLHQLPSTWVLEFRTDQGEPMEIEGDFKISIQLDRLNIPQTNPEA